MNNQEIWKDVIGYEGLYQVSNYGSVKGCERYVKHSKGGNLIIYEKLMKGRDNNYGYIQVGLSKNGKCKMFYIHRLVTLSFLGVSELEVDHKNHIRNDNRLENLEYVNHYENQKRSLSNKKGLPTGVHKVCNRYRAVIGIKYKKIHIGYFDTIDDANCAYLNKKNEILNERSKYV